MSNIFSRNERLTKTFQFQQVKVSGSTIRQSPFWIQAKPSNHDTSRIGIIVTKKLGNSVKRNFAKRVVREIFRQNKNSFPRPLDLVVIPRRSIFELKFTELETLFLKTLHSLISRI